MGIVTKSLRFCLKRFFLSIFDFAANVCNYKNGCKRLKISHLSVNRKICVFCAFLAICAIFAIYTQNWHAAIPSFFRVYTTVLVCKTKFTLLHLPRFLRASTTPRQLHLPYFQGYTQFMARARLHPPYFMVSTPQMVIPAAPTQFSRVFTTLNRHTTEEASCIYP